MSETQFEIAIRPAIVSEAELRKVVDKFFIGKVTYMIKLLEGGRKALLTAHGDAAAVRQFGIALNGSAFGKKVKVVAQTAPPPLAVSPAPAATSAPLPTDGLLDTATKRSGMTNGQQASRPPFHFVPKPSDLDVLDTPVDHHAIDLAGRYTGTLCCTLTALTPLLAANDQFEFQHATDNLKQAVRDAVGDEPHAEKKILEPLALEGPNPGIPGPVVIGGAAIKGMLRNALAALLAAPLERVQERHFSYRPNVRLDPRGDDLLLSRVGVVVEQLANGDLTALPAESLLDVCFIRDDALAAAFAAWGSAETDYAAIVAELQRAQAAQALADFKDRLMRSHVTVSDVEIVPKTVKGGAVEVSYRMFGRPGGREDLRDVYLLPYRFGLDGRGFFNLAYREELARAEQKRRRERGPLRPGRNRDGVDPRGYRWVTLIVRPGTPTVSIGRDAVEGWRRTLCHVRDETNGHLLRHPTVGELAGESQDAVGKLLAEGLRPGDVIFFEQDRATKRVVTLGHNFLYRWRYRDTIHGTGMRADASHLTLPESANLRLRAILCPPPAECEVDPQGRPKQLSAARLLFGYVGTTDGAYHDNQPTTFGLGSKGGDHNMHAGRIACNHAIEQNADRETTERFLNAAPHHLVCLKPLGSPKPSAVEHYLTQDRRDSRPDKGLLCTFGDTDGDTSAGTLNGRKFYLHQPDVGPDQFELFPTTGENRDLLRSQQTAVARFVSMKKTQFRLALRFVELRDWELGALLVVFDPTRSSAERLAQVWGGKAAELQTWLDEKGGAPDTLLAPLLAHKLGHGRPLGLGSIRIDVQRLLRLQPDESCLIAEVPIDARSRMALVDAFANRAAELFGARLTRWVKEVLIPWLETHRYVRRGELCYPADDNGEIFAYHTRLRADHVGGRKRRAAPRQHRGLEDFNSQWFQ